MGLTPDELAYMRATQADHHPAAFLIVNASQVPDGSGGMDSALVAETDQPVAGRLDAAPVRIPDFVASLVSSGQAASVSLTKSAEGYPLQKGDVLAEGWVWDQPYGPAYPAPRITKGWEVVTMGESDAWTTAVVVWVVPWRTEAGAHGHR